MIKMKKILLTIVFLIFLSINIVYAQEYEIKNYSSTYYLSSNTYNVTNSMNITALYSGEISIYLGNFIIDEVKINNQVFTGTISYNTIYFNAVQNNNYYIYVKGHGAISNDEISTSISSSRAISRIEFTFIFDPNLYKNLYVIPTPNQDLSIIGNTYKYTFTYKNSASASLKWYYINNSGINVDLKAVILVSDKNLMKARFYFNSSNYFNKITLILPDKTNWEINTTTPTKRYDFYTELDYGDNITFPSVKDAGVQSLSLLLYTYKNYKTNFSTSLQELTRYDPGVNLLISSLSDLVPVDYELSAIFKGKFSDVLSIQKTKLSEKPVISTTINSAKFNVFLTTRNFALVKADYYIVNTELNKYLELEIPQESIFWGAILEDNPINVYEQEGKILIPLKTSEKIGDTYTQMHLIFFYAISNETFIRSTPNNFLFITPKHNVPISKLEVKLAIPKEFSVLYINTIPSAESKIISYKQRLTNVQLPITRYGLSGEGAEIIGIAKSISVESPVEEVQLTLRGAPVIFQIPESNKYALVELNVLLADEQLLIRIYGERDIWMFFVFIVLVLLVIAYWKRKIVIKYLKKIW